MPEAPLGIAVIDKEAGLTSHDVVARGRKVFGTRKVGHSGTLDPGATGLLLLGVGRATRLLRFLTDLPKTYTTTVVLGTETDTLDDSGTVTTTHDMSGVTVAQIESAAAGFVGDIMQVPPMVSAVKIDGRRLHELAREARDRSSAPTRVDPCAGGHFDRRGSWNLPHRGLVLVGHLRSHIGRRHRRGAGRGRAST